MEYSPPIKIDELLIYTTTQKSIRAIMLTKTKLDTKEYRLCEATYMKFSNKQN